MMMVPKMEDKNIWERNSKGELVPQPAKVSITDTKLRQAILLAEFKLSQQTDEKMIAAYKRAIELLNEAKSKTERTIEIIFTPLMHYELVSLSKGLGCEGQRVQDSYADICARHCFDPIRTYEYWRDMKDPSDKKAIADFIYDKSFPIKEKTKEEKEAFQILQGLVLSPSSIDSDTTISTTEDLPNLK